MFIVGAIMSKRWPVLALILGWLGLSAPAFAQSDEDGDLDESVYLARLQVGLDYMPLWMRAPNVGALATSGSPNDPIPGAIGQPGTHVINPETFTHGAITAGRVTMVYWLSDTKRASLEGNFFIAEQTSRLFSVSSNGAPSSATLARPFFDPNFNEQNADPRALPNTLAGSINMNLMTRLLGAEAYARWLVSEAYSPADGFSVSVLGGVRWIDLEEKYLGNDLTTELPLHTGTTTNIQDNFTTFNQFFGGEFGAQAKFRWEHNLFCELQGKLALGENFQRLEVRGFTSITDSNGNVVATSGRQGLYAQPSNVGNHDRAVFAMVPEGSVNLGWDICDFLRLRVGYTFFYLTQALRPADQIDHTVNIQPLNFPGQIGPARPQVTLHETNFWVQYVSFGVEFLF
jgi:hypothetical protein